MKIGVAGLSGRVSELITQELLSGKWSPLTIGAGLSRNAKDPKFQKYDFSIYTDDQLDSFLDNSECVIDFTTPDSTLKITESASNSGVPLVIGTTGLSKDQENHLQNLAHKTPIVYAANMSLGVNLLMALVQQAAKSLDADWDIEIAETHHKHKKDAPSGTALALGKAAAAGREEDLQNLAVYDRFGYTGARKQGTIGFAVQRGGDVVGEHDVTFYGQGERITLRHVASDRSLFAKGALKAAQWVTSQSEPGLYTMKDVLGL